MASFGPTTMTLHTKHIAVNYHFLSHVVGGDICIHKVLGGDICIGKVDTAEELEDVLQKD